MLLFECWWSVFGRTRWERLVVTAVVVVVVVDDRVEIVLGLWGRGVWVMLRGGGVRDSRVSGFRLFVETVEMIVLRVWVELLLERCGPTRVIVAVLLRLTVAT